MAGFEKLARSLPAPGRAQARSEGAKQDEDQRRTGDEAIKGLAAAQRMRNGLLAVVAMLLTAVAGLLLWQIRSG